jgi:hypothetical protein
VGSDSETPGLAAAEAEGGWGVNELEAYLRAMRGLDAARENVTELLCASSDAVAGDRTGKYAGVSPCSSFVRRWWNYRVKRAGSIYYGKGDPSIDFVSWPNEAEIGKALDGFNKAYGEATAAFDRMSIEDVRTLRLRPPTVSPEVTTP